MSHQRPMETGEDGGGGALRPLDRVLQPGPAHWVGDGFYVRSAISPGVLSDQTSPFLLLDHAARRRFGPTDKRRGVGEHPHRGFETVTLAYLGEIEHRDSAGGGGRIGPGDVQWMTAGAGLVHEEMHARRLCEVGGELEMVQLWVNLPAARKMMPPGYQAISAPDLPGADLGPVQARVVAGELLGRTGPARTQTPMLVADLRWTAAGPLARELPAGWSVLMVPLEGEVQAGPQGQPVPAQHVALFARGAPGAVHLRAQAGARALLLAGQPLDEPVASWGPFVMNTAAQLRQAMDDYQAGRMGHLQG